MKMLRLFISILICELAGVIGSIFTASSVSVWYSTLNKPEFAPPNWVFGPVWTILFALMGVALFLVWEKKLKRSNEKTRDALMMFTSQLSLNITWSVIFFGLQRPDVAFLEILALWCVILATIVCFHRVSKVSAYLLIPYILWVTFAGYLNYCISILN